MYGYETLFLYSCLRTYACYGPRGVLGRLLLPDGDSLSLSPHEQREDSLHLGQPVRPVLAEVLVTQVAVRSEVRGLLVLLGTP